MKKQANIIVLFTAIIIILCSACNKDSTAPQQEPEQLYGADLSGEGGSILYDRREVEPPDVNILFTDIARGGDEIFLSAFADSSPAIYSFDAETEAPAKIDCNIDQNISSLSASPEGTFGVLMYGEGEDGDSLCSFAEFDKSGKRVCSFHIPEDLQENGGIIAEAVPVSQGILVLSLGRNIVLLDRDGELLHTYDNSQYVKNIVLGRDGSIIFCGEGLGGYTLEAFGADLKSSRKYTLNYAYAGALSYASEGHVFLFDDSNLYDVELETGDRVPVMNSAVNGFSDRMVPLSENSFLDLRGEKLVILEPEGTNPTGGAENEDDQELVVLKLATYEMSYELNMAVSRFNGQSGRTRIDVVDYSTYNTGVGSTDGLTLLNTEIIAGKLPDLFDLERLPIEAYANKGILEDLRPMIDSGEQFSYEDFIPEVMEVTERGGALYELVPCFHVDAFVGDRDTFKGDWNFDSFLRLADEARSQGKSIFPPDFTREDFIRYLLTFAPEDFCCKSSGECSFDGELFSRLLEFASRLPSEADSEGEGIGMYEEYGRVLSGSQYLTYFQSEMPLIGVLVSDGLFNGQAFVGGFPSSDGGRVGMSPCMELGLSSFCEHKDRAWDFFSFLLSEDFQLELASYQKLPVIRSAMEKSLERERELISEYGVAVTYSIEGLEADLDCGFPDNGTEEKVWAVLGSINCLSKCDEELYQIVMDEAQAYFSGQQDLETTVSVIQSRADIYISEQG